MSQNRKEVQKQDRWNVEALYKNLSEWQEHYAKLSRQQGDLPAPQPRWPEIEAFRGRLGEGAPVLKGALQVLLDVDRQLGKLYTYAHLRHDEDLTDDANKSAYQRALALCLEFQQATAWFNPEILSLPKKTLDALLSSGSLKDYRFHLEKIVHNKEHTLTPDKEELIAMAAKAMQAPHKAFSAINDADFSFGAVVDGRGEERELTHASYGLFLRDQDRTLRANAFTRMCQQYDDYENTLAELLAGEVQSHLFNASARRFPTCLDAALFPKNIDTAVYHSLVKAVRDNIGTLHRYIALRKQLLGVDTLHMYDMYVPLTSAVDIKMSYEEAEEVVIDSVAPLGTEYQNLLRKGLLEGRWVDRYENLHKRSGAYSSGCYDSMPYILMNYKGVLRDVFTLAHEAGHSMHSLYSRTHQPYHYADYPIFVAEVASTFNEELLMRLLLERASTREEKIFLINEKIEDIRATLFRQTMFAEFELFVHTMAEKGVPLTPSLLKEEYSKLVAAYFGDAATIDESIAIEWARIPHFYYNYYVYQYATGISAALSLAQRVVDGGNAERNAYLTFLKGGCSQYPTDLLRTAGVDVCTPQPVAAAIARFDSLVTELELAVSSRVC